MEQAFIFIPCSSMTTLQLDRLLCYGNLFAWLYFVLLAVLSYFPIELQLIQVLTELLILPLLLLVLCSVGYYAYLLFSKVKRPLLVMNLLLSMGCLVFLVVLTVVQMN